jgi:hypothetical protein
VKWFILLVGIVVVCAVVAMILGLAGGGLGRPTASLSHEPLPEGPIADDDFDDLVFDVSARGYRMGQVDGVIDRLRRELREKDEQIAVLRGDATEPDDAPEPTESTEPTEPTESTEPTEPTESTEPTEPTGASQLHEPAEAGPEVDAATARDSRTA